LAGSTSTYTLRIGRSRMHRQIVIQKGYQTAQFDVLAARSSRKNTPNQVLKYFEAQIY